MGWVMIIAMVVSSAVSAYSSYQAGVESRKQSQRYAEALEADKKRRQKDIARKTRKLAGHQKASFLASGISLTGDDTAGEVLGETYDFGMEDIKNVGEAYTNKQEQVLAKGRSDYNAGLLGAVSAGASGIAGIAGGLGGGGTTGGEQVVGGNSTLASPRIK